MESYLLDWANLLLRWVHVITAIAWIGSSFYFVFLDSSLTPPVDEDLKKQGVSGELWAVHGGGFYHPVKFAVSPPKLPSHLHWFYWESYSTWLSGFALFTVSYLWSASTYLIDKSKMDWAPATAIIVALAFLVVFWILYDVICRVFGQRKNGDAIVGVMVLGLVCIASWLACHWFAGRAAFLRRGLQVNRAPGAISPAQPEGDSNRQHVDQERGPAADGAVAKARGILDPAAARRECQQMRQRQEQQGRA